VLLVAAVALPVLRDGWRARKGDTPLQQVASAQRAVGEYLARHLPAGGTVMSYHPAIAIWARRDWRVLPYEPIDRMLPYAISEGVSVIALSRFDPSLVGPLPRAFTVIVLDSGAGRVAAIATDRLRLERVEETPLLFVGRPAETR
jgi:hypothetical protein